MGPGTQPIRFRRLAMRPARPPSCSPAWAQAHGPGPRPFLAPSRLALAFRFGCSSALWAARRRSAVAAIVGSEAFATQASPSEDGRQAGRSQPAPSRHNPLRIGRNSGRAGHNYRRAGQNSRRLGHKSVHGGYNSDPRGTTSRGVSHNSRRAGFNSRRPAAARTPREGQTLNANCKSFATNAGGFVPLRHPLPPTRGRTHSSNLGRTESARLPVASEPQGGFEPPGGFVPQHAPRAADVGRRLRAPSP